jgi:hypothetical protein
MRHGSQPCDLIGNARLPDNSVGLSCRTADHGGLPPKGMPERVSVGAPS